MGLREALMIILLLVGAYAAYVIMSGQQPGGPFGALLQEGMGLLQTGMMMGVGLMKAGVGVLKSLPVVGNVMSAAGNLAHDAVGDLTHPADTIREAWGDITHPADTLRGVGDSVASAGKGAGNAIVGSADRVSSGFTHFGHSLGL